MKALLSLFALVFALVFSGCRETDVRTMTVKVPAMASEEDTQRIRQAVTALNGVNKELLAFDLKGHTVAVTYDSMVVAHKNIEIAIAEAGYEANGIAPVRPPAK